MFKNDISTVVSGLLFRSGPAAVIWFVVAIVIAAVNGEAFFVTLAHIGDEVANIVPTVADGNTTTAVAWIFLVGWICASINHALPNRIERITPSAMFCYPFFVKASATLRLAITEVIGTNVARRTATRALYAGKKLLHKWIGFPVNSKHGKPAINIASRDDFRGCLNHGGVKS